MCKGAFGYVLASVGLDFGEVQADSIVQAEGFMGQGAILHTISVLPLCGHIRGGASGHPRGAGRLYGVTKRRKMNKNLI